MANRSYLYCKTKDGKISGMSESKYFIPITYQILVFDSGFVVNDKFGVTSHPTNFLIDSDYKIIDKNLNSENLKTRLIQLLE